MGVFSSPSLERPRAERRSVTASFAGMVAAPAAGLVIAWMAAVLAFGGGALAALVEGLLVAVAVVALARVFTRRMSADLAVLEAATRRADEQLPRLVERIRAGGGDEAPDPVRPLAGLSAAEAFRVAAAIERLRQTAVQAAIGEAAMREGIGKVFVSLARRNQSLLQRQLRQIDALEQKASDPATLAELFRLDHLTTRMRRHAEGLIILSGAAPGRSWSKPVPVIDVLRAAVAEVEDYKRVDVQTAAEDAVLGSAAADLTHLLAELIENGTLFSPTEMRVGVRAGRVTNGFAVEIDDRGLGIKSSQLSAVNDRLAKPPDFDLANADQLGLFVVGRLAVRHGVKVSLRPSPYGGTTAVVLLPASIMAPAAEPGADGPLDGAGVPEPQAGWDGSGWGGTPGQPGAGGEQAAAPGRPGPARAGARGAPDAAGARGGQGMAEAPAGQGGVGVPDAAGAGQGAAATYRGLPRRIRRGAAPETGQAQAAAVGASVHPLPAPPQRSPEETRDLLSMLQRGWQRGRAAHPVDGRPSQGPTAPAPAPAASDSEES